MRPKRHRIQCCGNPVRPQQTLGPAEERRPTFLYRRAYIEFLVSLILYPISDHREKLLVIILLLLLPGRLITVLSIIEARLSSLNADSFYL